MSTTPRTDEAWGACFGSPALCAADCARAMYKHGQQMEQQLAAVTKERDEAKARIAALEQALEPFANFARYVEDENDWPDDRTVIARHRENDCSLFIAAGEFRRAAAVLAVQSNPESIRCITFDKAAQAAIPPAIRAKMNADRAKAEAEMDARKAAAGKEQG